MLIRPRILFIPTDGSIQNLSSRRELRVSYGVIKKCSAASANTSHTAREVFEIRTSKARYGVVSVRCESVLYLTFITQPLVSHIQFVQENNMSDDGKSQVFSKFPAVIRCHAACAW